LILPFGGNTEAAGNTGSFFCVRQAALPWPFGFSGSLLTE